MEFEEKMYSVGKIPGGFNKREGKASENSILTARVIDRPMRPLFPKDYRNDVTLNNMVMSVDPECRPELVAMIGAALSTTISDIPFDGPCAMTQMGMKNGEFIVNPSQKDWDEGDLKLTVASTATKVIMIEAGANEIPEAKMIEAIYKCHDVNQTDRGLYPGNGFGEHAEASVGICGMFLQAEQVQSGIALPHGGISQLECVRRE